jgi:hypothetical protein
VDVINPLEHPDSAYNLRRRIGINLIY